MPNKRAIRVAILPEVAEELIQEARLQKIAVETLVNFLLTKHIHKPFFVA